MIVTIFLQVALPVALILWLALFPARNPLAYAVQILCVALLLSVIGLVGMWLILPWWTPYAYGLIFALVTLVTLATLRHRKTSSLAARQDGWASRAGFVAVILLTAYGIYLGANAVVGKMPPDTDVVDISSPLQDGTYLVAQGGSNRTLNDHYMTLDTSVPRFAAWQGQSKGLDIVRLNALGLRADTPQPKAPERYFAFGTKVLAPCNGRIVVAVDGIADMEVPQTDPANMLGNHVIVDCGGFFLVMAHFRNGSVLVTEGDDVTTGTEVAQIGNSGNSGEPHLHIHAQKDLPTDQPMSGTPLAITINGHFYARNARMLVKG